MQARLSPRLREYVVRWSRVGLAVASLCISVALIQADNKVATLERQRQTATERGAVIRDRLSTLEAEVAALQAQTTTTGTALVPHVSPRKPGKRPAGTTTPTTHVAPPSARPVTPPANPKTCRIIVPLNHACILSVQIGPISL